MEVYTIYIEYPSGEMFAKSFETLKGLLKSFEQHLSQVNGENYYTEKAKDYYTTMVCSENLQEELDFFEEFADSSKVYITKGPLGD